ncbi:LamG domain-containing protein [Cellulophaga baltica]|uniref:LamG domain-containing protein n=1 Tax=Cellulophaga baltica TaxID=76594 RepID=UPI0004281266|nr:LamG domain-containing protein [Cellulophaga baltica]
MKKLRYSLLALVAVLFIYSCDQGIDGITQVDPGVDATAPAIKINYPKEGIEVNVLATLADITIDFEVTDDIEVKDITVLLDDVVVGTFTSFKDYRRVLIDDLVYSGLEDGTHVLTISATDIEGKNATSSVSFEKVPAYVKKYDGEVFYMPFDGDYVDLISFQKATIVGTPSFTDDALNGTSAYAGVTDSYLTFPAEDLKAQEFSAVFWTKLNAVPDRAGLLVMSPPLDASGGNVLTSGYRFFRENADGLQRFKLNAGSGADNTWVDGGAAADVDPSAGKWVNMAFTVSGTEASVYIDGQLVQQVPFNGIDWTDVNVLSIMSGAPNFSGWDHKSDLGFMDELRIFNKSLSQAEIETIIQDDSGISPDTYTGTFDGEMFYMPFDGDHIDLFSTNEATIVGNAGFAGEAKVGDNAYAGATDSYLTVPTTGLTTSEFSAAMWYKVNDTPDRAGILTVGPPDTENAGFPEIQNLRTSGFRLLRENADGLQRIKLNVGNGDGEEWADGGTAADIDPAAGEWVHLAFTISETTTVVYINGVAVANAETGISWANCDLVSIGSGAPRFTEWGHGADLSYMDELRFFDKALTPEQVTAVMNAN